ncbi:restriction endonuclease subunit S [Bifidobacterium callitrichidarum]|uniref:restriction endonuclease subunit S n=1 Tax=Bifidobacterium callitrichidarum TaxID=2052941 RepID=UPI001304B289|nr:restriction endonuclease subunit S [Bifidobacterium callitrichidarum]
MGEIIRVEDSKRIPLSKKEREKRKGRYPYYGAASVMDYVSSYLFDDVRLLMGEDGTVTDAFGHPSLQYVWGKYWVNNHAHVLAGTKGVTTEQLYVALSDLRITEYITGAVQPKLNQKNMKSIPVEWPDAAPSFDYEFRLYRTNCSQISLLTELRDALLPKLMSGELDVSRIELPTPPTQILMGTNGRLSE